MRLVGTIAEIKKEIQKDDNHYYVDVSIIQGSWIRNYYITLTDDDKFVVEEYLESGSYELSEKELDNSNIGKAIKDKKLFFVEEDDDFKDKVIIVTKEEE